MPRRVALLLALFLAPVVTAAGPLDGRWRLVEQHYGEGETNLAGEELPLRLEFADEQGTLVGRVWAGEERSQATPWPALVVAGETKKIQVDEQNIDAATGEVSARYRVEPAPGDGLVLEITERYKLSADGQSLAGTVEVRFVRDGESRGGYLLKRRFARES